MYRLLLLCSLIILVSCKQTVFKSPEALMEYIKNPDNGYYQEKTVNGVTFGLLYKPTDLLVAQEISKKATQKEVDSLRNKYGKYAYFNLFISKNNKELLSTIDGDRQQFGMMVNKLAFGMQKHIMLINENEDVIEMLDYIHPRTYGTANKSSFMLVYQKKDLENTTRLDVVISDIGFGTGNLKFVFNKKEIKKLFENKKLW